MNLPPGPCMAHTMVAFPLLCKWPTILVTLGIYFVVRNILSFRGEKRSLYNSKERKCVVNNLYSRSLYNLFRILVRRLWIATYDKVALFATSHSVFPSKNNALISPRSSLVSSAIAACNISSNILFSTISSTDGWSDGISHPYSI